MTAVVAIQANAVAQHEQQQRTWKMQKANKGLQIIKGGNNIGRRKNKILYKMNKINETQCLQVKAGCGKIKVRHNNSQTSLM